MPPIRLKKQVYFFNIIPSNPANPTEQGICIISPGNSSPNYYLALNGLTDWKKNLIWAEIVKYIVMWAGMHFL